MVDALVKVKLQVEIKNINNYRAMKTIPDRGV